MSVIVAIHGLDGQFHQLTSSGRTGPWMYVIQSIQKVRDRGLDLKEFCCIIVENGCNTILWHDRWWGNTPISL